MAHPFASMAKVWSSSSGIASVASFRSGGDEPFRCSTGLQWRPLQDAGKVARPIVLAATRGAEGATEEERVTVLPVTPRGSSVSAPPHPITEPPLAAPSSGSLSEAAASSIDRIELQAKSSIDKLKHLLYKLKTRPSIAETTVLRSAPEGVTDAATPSSMITEEQQEVYISQKIEVDLSIPQEVVEDDAPMSEPALSETMPVNAERLEEIVSMPTKQLKESEPLSDMDSVTCTRTTVQFDEENHTAVVTVTATVRGTELISGGAYTERTIALAARALARTCLALDEKAQLAALVAGPIAEILLSARQQQRHDKMLRHLAFGEIVSFKPLAEGAGASPFREVFSVVLRSEEGETMEALFKPRMPGDVHGCWKRAPMDWVAYQVSLLLGLDIVPPAAIRNDVRLGSDHFSTGVMVYKVSNARPLANVPPKQWGEATPAVVVSNAHILDALLGCAPRRKEAFHAGEHWAMQNELRPLLLDFPMGPGLGELHSVWSKRRQMTGVKHASPITLSRLRGLNRGILLENLSGALTADEMEILLEKRDQIMSYFDALAGRQLGHVVLH